MPKMSSKKANISSFLKLTMTSQLKTNDKVTKIFQIFNDRNGKLLEYLTEILLKSYLAAVNALASIALGIKDVTPDALVQSLREMIESSDEFGVLAAKNPDSLANLKKCIGLSRQLDHLRDSIFK